MARPQRFRTALFGMALIGLLCGSGRAAIVTGNPLADGWGLVGNSESLGIYVRGSGSFDFDVYTATQILTSGSTLYNGVDWLSGDTVIGLGGVLNPPNTNLTSSIRIVAKWGGPTSTFTASTTTVPPGDGDGSFSGGFGGNGAILLGTTAGDFSGRPAGTPQSFSVGQNYTGVVNTLPAADRDAIGRLMLTKTGGGALDTFETFLNVSLLGRLGYTNLPVPGGQFILTLQRGTSTTLFTDALGNSAPAPAAVPEPATLATAGLAGLAALAYARLRRRRAD